MDYQVKTEQSFNLNLFYFLHIYIYIIDLLTTQDNAPYPKTRYH